MSLQHLLEGKELNRANVIVMDPRMTRTAAHATDFVRIRPGTDIPVLYGMLWHIFKNGWEDKQFIQQRVYGMDEVRQEVEKWTPEEIERVTGVPEAQMRRVAETFAKQKPACLIWAMGQTQHTVGTANVRASCILLMATGNVGNFGNGANPFRGHDNVQGASDMGLDIATLPLYYGLTEGAWQHWARVWEADIEWLRARFENPKMMNTSGIPLTRWFDATMLPKDQVEQKDNIKAMLVFGFNSNTITRIPVAAQGVERLDLLVVCDPHPTNWAVLGNRRNGTYLLPTCTQYKSRGTRTASNGSLQLYEQIVKPLFESKNDGNILYLLAGKLGLADRVFKNIKTDNGDPLAEDVLSEINRGGWSTGYTGQSPERLKAHLRNQHKFDPVTLRAPKDDPEVGGDYYGLPWPCWGTPELRHPGTPMLYNTGLHVMDGGGTFRARFGVEREVKLPDGTIRKHNLLAEGSYSVGSEIQDGYPEFTYGVLKKLGWDKDLKPEEVSVIERIGGGDPDGVSWSTDLSGGIQRVAMRTAAFHTATPKRAPLLGTCPTRSRSTASRSTRSRPELVAKYPTLPNANSSGVPNLGFDVQEGGGGEGYCQEFPADPHLGPSRRIRRRRRGDHVPTSGSPSLQQDMFIEINPADAAERGIRNRDWVHVWGPEMAERQERAA